MLEHGNWKKTTTGIVSISNMAIRTHKLKSTINMLWLITQKGDFPGPQRPFLPDISLFLAQIFIWNVYFYVIKNKEPFDTVKKT